MLRTTTSKRVLAVALSLLTIVVTAPFSLAETFAAARLGAIITPGKVTVGGSVAPTGTTLFAGEQVSVSEAPALIQFNGGSRIEMTRAAATYSREGNALIVQANRGLLRFNFKRGEQVQINAGRFQFTAVGNGTAHNGELGLNLNGQVAMNLSEGTFAVLDTVTGERNEVLPSLPFQATDIVGKGQITKGGKTLTDTSKSWTVDELKGKCVVAGGEAFAILSNTPNELTLKKGAWKLATGSYDYKIVECNKDALVAAGASAAAAGAAVGAAGAAAAGAAAAGAAAAGAISATTVAIVAGVAAAAVGLGVGVAAATSSPSSR
jgi:hypothetical protein